MYRIWIGCLFYMDLHENGRRFRWYAMEVGDVKQRSLMGTYSPAFVMQNVGCV